MDSWRIIKLPLSVRDQFRDAIVKVGKAADIKIEDWPAAGTPGSGTLVGGQVAALECLCVAINQMDPEDLKYFLMNGARP